MANNSKQVMVRMPPELYERLSGAADMTMTTPSAMARILIKQQLDQWTLPGDDDHQPLEPEASSDLAGPVINQSRDKSLGGPVVNKPRDKSLGGPRLSRSQRKKKKGR